MHRRKKKLINTRLQLRWTLWFVGITAMTLLLQFTVLYSTLAGMEELRDASRGAGGPMAVLVRTFLLSTSAALALALVTGILLSHRVAGPLYRFTKFLEAVERGEQREACRIRENDELHDFCAVLNRATASLRERATPESDAATSAGSDAPPADEAEPPAAESRAA